MSVKIKGQICTKFHTHRFKNHYVYSSNIYVEAVKQNKKTVSMLKWPFQSWLKTQLEVWTILAQYLPIDVEYPTHNLLDIHTWFGIILYIHYSWVFYRNTNTQLRPSSVFFSGPVFADICEISNSDMARFSFLARYSTVTRKTNTQLSASYVFISDLVLVDYC